jgi:DNA-binding HxlR family transcriptional regulator
LGKMRGVCASCRRMWPVQKLNPAGTETELGLGRGGAYAPADRGGPMAETGYRQFCPVAMASEILCRRWTILVLRELIAGSARFNDLRRGLPRLSPALLSQRLKELEAADIVRRVAVRGESGLFEYHLTEAGQELKPIVEAFGVWAQRWVSSDLSLERLDAQLLMWDMRRNLDPAPLPDKRQVIRFQYPELPAAKRSWWLLVSPETGVDLCALDPGFDVDLYVTSDLRTMTAIWMGFETVPNAQRKKLLTLTGDRKLAAAMPHWLGLSPFAKVQKKAG